MPRRSEVARPAVSYLVRAGPLPQYQPKVHLFPAFEAMITPPTPQGMMPMARPPMTHQFAPPPRSPFLKPAPRTIHANTIKNILTTLPVSSNTRSPPASAKPTSTSAAQVAALRKTFAKIRAEADLLKAFREKLKLKPAAAAEPSGTLD